MKKIFCLIAVLCATLLFSQQKQESLKINWPEEYKWKTITDQEKEQIHFIEVIPGNETGKKWTLLGTMTSIKGIHYTVTSKITDLYKKSSLAESPDAKLTLLEKDDTAKNIWIIFKVETPRFPDDPVPESQLYYAIQGEETLYVNFIAVKKKTLQNDFIEKWSTVFKASRLVY